MPKTDLERLDADLAHPRIVELYLALTRLKSTISFMNSGAHPDDETSALLATLSVRDGMDISTACANRGEGGQNDIGTDTAAQLGTLRTAEMEQAAKALGLRHYWLSTHVDDSITDFGFSKDGIHTLSQWGHDRALERFVSIVRRERPDILCPTFLDVPGQHGHHRAMTALAHEVIECAADASFNVYEQNEPVFALLSESHNTLSPNAKVVLAQRLERASTPWQISKLYLPAWGGGGGAYDDEQPPPSPTLCVSAKGHDPCTGWSYENIAQQSRRCHLSQGMGRWIDAGAERDWPLHLAWSCTEGPDDTLEAGLPSNLQMLAELTDDNSLKQVLIEAHELIQLTLDTFPEFEAVYSHAFSALNRVQQATKLAQASESIPLAHRLERKEQQLAKVIMLASGIRTYAHIEQDWWYPGDRATLTLPQHIPDKYHHADAAQFNCSVVANYPWQYDSASRELKLHCDAHPANPYPDTWIPDEPAEPFLSLSLKNADTVCTVKQAFDLPPVICPSSSVNKIPGKCIINALESNRPCTIHIAEQYPEHAAVSVSVPDNWSYQFSESTLRIHPPAQLKPGLYECPIYLNDKQAFDAVKIDYPHITPRLLATPAVVSLCCVPVALPDVRIGYIGGGNDTVDHWLSSMGLSIIKLSNSQFADDTNLSHALESLDTLVIGVFAYRMARGLSSRTKLINQWVHDGGHLLTLYHRPWDAWDPESVPPRPLVIGEPSLRYRITDKNAAVTYLQADHPLLNTPNEITDKDWQGWHKERGLYFAKSWDSAYTPLLSMSDPYEAPHTGALLSADIGKGRHTHTSLILHYQMQQLVPGSFRLMANLVS